MSEATARTGLDPRGPRFAASVTALLLLVAVLLSLTGASTAGALGAATVAERASDAGFVLVALIAALFAWSVVSPQTAPYGVIFRRVIRPRLSPPEDLEDPRPPRFAQGVGLFVTSLGLVLHLAGVPWALPIAAAAAFVAAFLNAAFGLCLGCQMYLGLQRAGLVGRPQRTA